METLICTLIKFILNISPEVIAGVGIFIISERYRNNQKKKEDFNQTKIELGIYFDSWIDYICSASIEDDDIKTRENIMDISRNIRTKYSIIKGKSLLLKHQEKEKWQKIFKEIEDEDKIFALINTIGTHNTYVNGVDRSEQIKSIKRKLEIEY